MAVKSAADFDQSMANVYSVMAPDEVSQFSGALKNLAITMGADTKYSATEAAQGIEELLKAGVSVTDIMNGGLKGALSLATAGELSLGDAAEIASTALNAFKNDNLSVQQAADILAGAANASATSVSELKFGLSSVSAVASSVGWSFKDTTTALAEFAQNGLIFSSATWKQVA
jgi:TP901 family phage tail tape measure protein